MGLYDDVFDSLPDDDWTKHSDDISLSILNKL